MFVGEEHFPILSKARIMVEVNWNPLRKRLHLETQQERSDPVHRVQRRTDSGLQSVNRIPQRKLQRQDSKSVNYHCLELIILQNYF